MNERKQIIPDKDEMTTSPKIEAKGKETILVVDDDKEVRGVAVKMLDSLGYEVLEAENGPSALIVLEKKAKDIDLVFSDVVMTLGMSGFELAQELSRRYPHIKILLTSGYPKKVIDKDGIAKTGITLLRKPYKKAHLAEAVRTGFGSVNSQVSGKETTGFRSPPAVFHNPLNVRYGSLADISRLPSEGPLSGAKRTFKKLTHY